MTSSAEFARGLALAALGGLLLAGCAHHAAKTTSSGEASTPASPSSSPQTPASSTNKGSPEQQFQAALDLMKKHQDADAQTAFAALAKAYPDDSGPLTNLGILQARNQQLGPAVDSLQRAVHVNPNNVVALNWLGSLARQRGDTGLAERSFQAAIAAKPDYAPAHLNLGLLYDQVLRRPSDALAQYRDYQRLTGGSRLIVDAWIRELEPAAPVAPKPVTAVPSPSRALLPAADAAPPPATTVPQQTRAPAAAPPASPTPSTPGATTAPPPPVVPAPAPIAEPEPAPVFVPVAPGDSP